MVWINWKATLLIKGGSFRFIVRANRNNGNCGAIHGIAHVCPGSRFVETLPDGLYKADATFYGSVAQNHWDFDKVVKVDTAKHLDGIRKQVQTPVNPFITGAPGILGNIRKEAFINSAAEAKKSASRSYLFAIEKMLNE